jgi:hypothetical protein
MPHIKLKSGRTYHDIDSTIASLFVEAGLAEYFTPVQLGSKIAPRPTVPVFCVVLNSERNRFEIVCTMPSGGVMRFSGEPRHAKDAFKSLTWSPSAQAQTLQGPEPPASILSEYASAYGLPSAEVRTYIEGKQKAEEQQAEADARGARAAQAAQQ